MFDGYHPSTLGEEGLNEVRSLEAELGKVVVALERDIPPAQLTEDQVARIQALEKKLGVVIVALDT